MGLLLASAGKITKTPHYFQVFYCELVNIGIDLYAVTLYTLLNTCLLNNSYNLKRKKTTTKKSTEKYIESRYKINLRSLAVRWVKFI